VLLITPRVVRNIERPAARVEEFNSGTELEVGRAGAAASPAPLLVPAPASEAPAAPPPPSLPAPLPPAAGPQPEKK